MPKEYTFQEVHQRIKPGQTYECTVDDYNVKKIQMDRDGFIKVYQECHHNEVVIAPKARYRLIQKPVTFMEAVNSGKEIKYETWNGYRSIQSVLNRLASSYDSETIRKLINGKWYIEEDDNE